MSFQGFLQSLVTRAAEDPVYPNRKKESTQWNQYGIVNIIFVISAVESVLYFMPFSSFVCSYAFSNRRKGGISPVWCFEMFDESQDIHEPMTLVLIRLQQFCKGILKDQRRTVIRLFIFEQHKGLNS